MYFARLNQAFQPFGKRNSVACLYVISPIEEFSVLSFT